MKYVKLAIFSIIILVVLFSFGFFATNILLKIFTRHGDEVMVPDLIGKNFKEARNDLIKYGLYIEKTGEDFSNEILKGYIISQKPSPNIHIKKGKTIKVIVSKGKAMTEVPILDNLTITEAKIRLQNVKLQLGKVSYAYSNDIGKNKVIYSQPIAGAKVAKNSMVELIISLGKLPTITDKKDMYKSLLEDALKDTN